MAPEPTVMSASYRRKPAPDSHPPPGAVRVAPTEAVSAAIEQARASRAPCHIAPFLFCTRRGECYVKDDGTANGWDSIWQRFMDRVLTETKVKERFTEHDLRAKCASDAGSLEHARALLAHADSRLTERVYRRKREWVKPLR